MDDENLDKSVPDAAAGDDAADKDKEQEENDDDGVDEHLPVPQVRFDYFLRVLDAVKFLLLKVFSMP